MTFYVVSSDHLEHHGIKGQKWGVRRFQDKNGRLTAAGKARLKGPDTSNDDAGKTLNTKGSPALLLAVPLVAVSARAIDTGQREIRKAIYRNNNPAWWQTSTDYADEESIKEYEDSRKSEKKFAKKVTSETDLKKKENIGTPEEDMAEVNPNRNTKGYTKNCMYCSAAFDLRRRGYDVNARSRDSGGIDLEISDWYVSPKTETYETAKDTIAAAKSQPNGSRGMISGQGPWGGHELAYEVNNSKLTIYDAQANKVWSEAKFKKFYAQGTVTRLDNVEPNWKGIGEVISEDSVNKKE